MSEKHTPGPWCYWACTVDSTTGMRDYLQFAAGAGHVARIPIRSVTEADARLIAAAPELLFQLLAASNYIDTLGGNSKSYRAAIAKATGATHD